VLDGGNQQRGGPSGGPKRQPLQLLSDQGFREATGEANFLVLLMCSNRVDVDLFVDSVLEKWEEPQGVRILLWSDGAPERVLAGTTFRLPAWVRCDRLPTTAALFAQPPKLPSWNQWASLVGACFDMRLEREAAHLRHEFAGLAAAVRIYLGALILGVADRRNARAVLACLASKLRSCDVSRSPDPSSFLSTLESYILFQQRKGMTDSDVSRQPDESSRCITGVGRDVIMLDDRWEEDGWGVVIPELLSKGRSQFHPFGRWSDLVDSGLLPKDGKEVEPLELPILLLDCSLGEDECCGLELLPALRSRTIDLPIVFLTGHDDVRVALWALREGASSYYVKCLVDRRNRVSADYCEAFRRLLEPVRFEREIRLCWNLYASKRKLSMDSVLVAAGCPRGRLQEVGARTSTALDLCFYVLLSYLERHRWWSPGRTELPRETWTEQVTAHSVATLIALAVTDHPLVSWRESIDKNGVRNLLQKARHGSVFTLEEALSLLLNVVSSWLRGSPALRTTVDPGWACASLFDVTPLRRPDYSTRGRLPAGVEVRQLLSLAFEQGIPMIDAQERLRLAAVRVLPVGSFEHLELPLHLTGLCKICGYDSSKTFELIARSDVVLLDADSSEVTVELIEAIRMTDPVLPIVLLQTCQDALQAVQALKAGATEVLVFLPRNEDEADAFATQFTSNLISLLAHSRDYRHSLPSSILFNARQLADFAIADTRQVALASSALLRIKGSPQWPRVGMDAVHWFCTSLESMMWACRPGPVLQLGQSNWPGRFVGVGFWKLQALRLEDPSVWERVILWMSCHLVERMAMWRQILTVGGAHKLRNWGGELVISKAMSDLCPDAEQLWKARCKGVAPARRVTLNVLWQCFCAYRRFFSRAMNSSTRPSRVEGTDCESSNE